MGIVETLRTTAAPAARASVTVAPAVLTPTRSADRRQRERCAPTGSAAASTATAEPRRTTAVPAARANAPTHSLVISINVLSLSLCSKYCESSCSCTDK
ncbi:Chitin recognition protein [Musa troglodytarum]|uniref:Chitin recognition protein n=1 Tax=Musa troglodytarum TaxID=320322 RepID=A0A9E7ELV3_9LILI|nr:Chitin recognition protein [Musa troglodytarum]